MESNYILILSGCGLIKSDEELFHISLVDSGQQWVNLSRWEIVSYIDMLLISDIYMKSLMISSQNMFIFLYEYVVDF